MEKIYFISVERYYEDNSFLSNFESNTRIFYIQNYKFVFESFLLNLKNI